MLANVHLSGHPLSCAVTTSGGAIRVRWSEVIALGALWVGLGSASAPQQPRPVVSFTPVQLDPTDPAHLRVGALTWLGGWQLQSRDPKFGGYSSLATHGGRFIALSDFGVYLLFHQNAKGGFETTGFGNLPDYPGRRGVKGDQDSESMVIGPNAEVWVGFEQYNAIYRYSPGLRAMTAHARPPAMKDWPGNEGPEAMVRLGDGRFIVFAENARQGDDSTEALLCAGDPTDANAEPTRFGYRPPDPYVAVDAQQLPDGRVLVLNRHFALADGLWTALTIFDPKDIRAGQTIEPKLLAEIRPPLTIDNMEGMAVTVEKGRTIVWMISDDNQKPVQRTLLFKFALRI